MGDLACPAPWLQPHYRAFIATTSWSASVPRIGTLPHVALATRASPSRRPGSRQHPVQRSFVSKRQILLFPPGPATSSRHLYTGHRQGHEQAAPWLRTRPTGAPLSRGWTHAPVSMSSLVLSMRQQWFTHVRLLVAHLTRWLRPSPQSLPTPALDRHDTAVVWDLRLHGEPGGPPSIPDTARFVLAIFYIDITPLSGHTHPRTVTPPGRWDTSAPMGYG